MPTTTEIASDLRAAGKRLTEAMTAQGWNTAAPMVTTFGGTSPYFSVDQIVKQMNRVADRVAPLKKAELERDELGSFLAELHPQIAAMQFNALAQNSAQQANHALTLTNMIASELPQFVPTPQAPKVDWEDLKDEKGLLPKDLARRLRFVATRLEYLEPRSAEIDQKIAEIESAHATAEQLPTDMAELASRRDEIKRLAEDSGRLAGAVEVASERVQEHRTRIEQHIADSEKAISVSSTTADALIKKSEQALRGATSVGLARAFDARKVSLTNAGMAWTFGLLCALVSALYIGANRVENLKDVLVSDKSATVIWVNTLLTLFGVGGPIWFAWLSTKQIGTNFRLAEDYAFKASVSQAYEGYRTEAAELQDPMLSQRLFSSALDRLEEAPIRLLDPTMHSSPLAELLSNPSVRKSLEGIPGIADKVIALIPTKGAAAVVAPVAAIAAAATAVTETGAKTGGDPE